jgi:ADP-ribose pyrophosphatase YjhB (NUDIX family)
VTEDARVAEATGAPTPVPRLPVSVGAMIFDAAGRLLVLEPTYKSGWTLPGGQMEADGESPWEACAREVREETALVVGRGRLRCVDFLRPRPGHHGGVRLLFDCGEVSSEQVSGIVVRAGEIAQARFADEERALELLRGPVRRRVEAALRSSGVIYLEDGRRVDAVS